MARLNVLRHAADNAAYESARHGIVPGATVSEVEQKAHEYLNAVKVSGATVTVSPNPITETTTDITVDVALPLDGNVWVTSKFTDNSAINASCSLRSERYRGIQSMP